MTGFSRYAVYALPEGRFHDRGSDWLGWDAARGVETSPPELPGLPAPAVELTETPRKYGFHGTLKPPFRLATGRTQDDLQAALAAFAAGQPAVVIPALAIRPLGRFVAIVPERPSQPLATLASAIVRELDAFRAPARDDELARRRAAGLTPRQEQNLTAWGYPYVFEDFRFHITLSGRVKDAGGLAAILSAHFVDVLPRPFRLENLALMGEGADGRFRLVHRYALSG